MAEAIVQLKPGLHALFSTVLDGARPQAPEVQRALCEAWSRREPPAASKAGADFDDFDSETDGSDSSVTSGTDSSDAGRATGATVQARLGDALAALARAARRGKKKSRPVAASDFITHLPPALICADLLHVAEHLQLVQVPLLACELTALYVAVRTVSAVRVLCTC